MSTVDERIVSMKFDNKQFESGVSTTLSSLNKLKSGLNLSGATKGLDDVSSAAKKVNFDGMTSGLETVKSRFSALEVVAVTALVNITNNAINAGKNLISSLTLDPIMDGFREYETQMNAIQTILANTSSKGTTLDEVNAALSELNTYADQTIYNFTEMTRNIGTFTAAGVDLKTSTAAIKGIANLAAVSGSNSQQASTAMYQLSQAIASGQVNLQDWNSVVNAGMGGAVFQNALKQTAKVMGKTIDETQSFRDSISAKDGTGWLTSDVLLATLEQFTGDMSEAELASQGYTQQQISDIMKMGVTANEAATKVKTFTQLMDTLKEAVGSGWAQTWQIIFGDFEEAKTLFTGVSDTLGAMINATSQARNEMLSGWKDLGGRTVLIDAIKNAFDGVMGVVTALTSAFRDIFPATTAQQLYNITLGFKNFTEGLKLSDGTLYNLRSTFKGIFAILDIGKTILLAVANAIGIMSGGVGNLGSGILGITGMFGNWLAELDNVIKQSDIFNKVLSGLAIFIKTGFSGVSTIFETISKTIGSVIGVINSNINFPGFEAFHSFLDLISKRMTSVGESVDSLSTSVGGAFVAMGKAVLDSGFGDFLISIWETTKKVADGIGTLVSKMASSISKAFTGDFDGVFDAVASISIGGVAIALAKFLKGIAEPFSSLSEMFEGVTGILDGVRGCFEAYQTQLKAGALLKIAAAIGILAAAILTISLIDSNKLASSLAAIGGLFTQLLIAMKVFTLIGNFKTSVLKANAVMISMSAAILILSVAMKNLGSLDWNGIAKGTVGIAALSTTLVASMKVLSSGNKSIIKGSAGMVVFAAAIKVLASACADLAKLSWDGIAKGLVGVGVLMTEISLFLNTAKFGSKTISTAAGIVVLASAMKILASACADFGSLSWTEIAKGLTSVGLLLAEISIFTKLTANSKNVISTGLGLIALAGAMTILSTAMSNFGNISWESIAKGLVVMAGALTEITIAMKLLPTNLPITATGLLIVGGALNAIAAALSNMGGMSWDGVAKGLVALGGSLGILAIGLNAMNGSLPGSAALLVAAGALAILAPTLSLLGAMTWESIVKGLVELASVIAIFGVSAAILTPIIPSMIGLASALVLLGLSMTGIGAGLALVGVGLAGIATGFTLLAGVTATGATAIVASLGIIITGIAALIPAILEKIGEGLIAFCKVFIDGIPTILEAVNAIIKAMVDCIVVNIPYVLDGVLKTLSAVLDALIKWVPTISQKVIDIILALLKIMADNIPKFVEAGVNIVIGFVQGVANSLSKVIDAAFKLIVSFINGLADAIRTNSGDINSACVNLISAVVEGIGNLGSQLVECGVNAVKGFIKGLGSMMSEVVEAGKNLASKALNSVKNALDIHSPSREFDKVGVFSGKGLVNGLNSYSTKVANAGYNMGRSAINSLTNAVSGISDIVNSDIDSNPTIRPVMDLSEIQNGSRQLYGMLDNIDTYNLDGSLNMANNVSRLISRQQLVEDPLSNNSSKLVTNNNTPKQPMTLQLVLQNGRAIAEYIIDDIDTLMGGKQIITERMIGG